MRNVLSVDVEDYFHVEAFASTIPPCSWDSRTSRVEQNVQRVLELLGRHGARATFFVLGWVAERFPNVVRDIAAEGHEVGSHGYGHHHLRRLSHQQFREDLRKARDCLAGQAQRRISAYRAPSFSIVKQTLWALDILAEEGFRTDSSVFPIRHDLYGMPEAPRFPHWRGSVFEFPPSTIQLLGNNIGIGGGGYLRILPYRWTRWALRRLNRAEKQPAMVYFHPWEIDPDQPRIAASVRSRLRHYTGQAGMEKKLDRLLSDFPFGALSEVCRDLAVYRKGAGAAEESATEDARREA